MDNQNQHVKIFIQNDYLVVFLSQEFLFKFDKLELDAYVSYSIQREELWEAWGLCVEEALDDYPDIDLLGMEDSFKTERKVYRCEVQEIDQDDNITGIAAHIVNLVDFLCSCFDDDGETDPSSDSKGFTQLA